MSFTLNTNFKIFIGVVFAATLFIIGSIQLISLRSSKTSLRHVVIDFEPFCNNTTYLDSGSSESFLPISSEENRNSSMLQDEEIFALDHNEQYLTICDGQTLHSILRQKNVSKQEIANLGLALRPYLQTKDLAAGDFYHFDLIEIDDQNNIVDNFVVRKLDSRRLPILYRAIRTHNNLNGGKFLIEVHEPKITEELAVLELTVTGTLYQTFNKIPFGNELMQRLMAVFAWEMRMPEEVVEGDHIELLVVKKYALGDFTGYGKIHMVYYQQKNRTLFATFFVSRDKKTQGFFDEKGKSLEKEFSYSPVDEITATSNQKWRLHPIRKIRIRHNGIDYRGTVGTEFFSIADGEVIEKKFDQNVGNMIRIKHKYGVHSEYFHAHTLEDRVKVGHRVKRGQKIGTIGRTGKLCTGPHLHMGLYKMKGEQRKFIELSSLRKILNRAPDIDSAHMGEFNENVINFMTLMDKQRKVLMADLINNSRAKWITALHPQ
jgi:murein DD-endopeptidase MepM/ murein hydrolase activator NlpD